MNWLEHLLHLRSTSTPVVMVTLVEVRGHAPRDIGAKMLVTLEQSFDTIGGGNLEAMAIEMARGMLRSQARGALRQTLRLTHEQSLFGVQCCGGEVEILFEPVPITRACVAIFGLGHVGFALAKVLSIMSIDLWVIDSRPEMLEPMRLQALEHSQANVIVQSMPVLDGIVKELPTGAHLLIMTHDHSEDLFVLKAALARKDLGFIGLIGSSVKWQRFQKKLLETGFSNSSLARVTSPIGLPEVIGKSPQAIAIAVAAQLIGVLQLEPIKKQTNEVFDV
jgi:xanthine dehydrogenase accessory factor